MDIYDYYLSLSLYTRNKIPNDITRHIFSFVKDDVKSKIDFEILKKEIKRMTPIHKRIMRDFYVNL
jgi:hypothetical protein